MDNEVSAALMQAIAKEKIKLQLAPPHLWDRLIPQACMTLNMLRPSHLNLRISAEKQLNGMHDFNSMPLAPPSTKVIVHEKSTVRGTWSPHGVDGWYIGPSPHHY
eukprot:189947-Ditylum_brightwellii.AAC.1